MPMRMRKNALRPSMRRLKLVRGRNGALTVGACSAPRQTTPSITPLSAARRAHPATSPRPTAPPTTIAARAPVPYEKTTASRRGSGVIISDALHQKQDQAPEQRRDEGGEVGVCLPRLVRAHGP